MGNSSTLQVHRQFFDLLNGVAGRGHLLLKGHWYKGISGDDERAIRETIDAALSLNKWMALRMLKLYGIALKGHHPTSACCFSHTARIQALISLRLNGESVDTMNLPRVIHVQRYGANEIGHENWAIMQGNHPGANPNNPHTPVVLQIRDNVRP